MPLSKSIEVDSTLGKMTVDLETGKWYLEGKEYSPPHRSLETKLNERKEK